MQRGIGEGRTRADHRQIANAMYANYARGRDLRRLEAIVHPLVRAHTEWFLAAAARARQRLVVLDIPLLFETGGKPGDAVLVVTAPAFLQA